MRISVVAFAVTFTFSFAAHAQNNPLLHSGSIGASCYPQIETVHCPTDPFADLPLSCWVRKGVAFLPPSPNTPPRKNVFGITYSEAAGETATVVSLEPIGGCKWELTIEMDSDGSQHSAVVYSKMDESSGRGVFDAVHDVALLSDVVRARDEYLGDTLWTMSRTRLNTFDAESQRLGEVEVDERHPLVVENIVLSWESARPVRFILRTYDGRSGFIDVDMSGSHSSSDSWLFRTVLASEPSERDVLNLGPGKDDVSTAAPFSIEGLNRTLVYAPLPEFAEKVNANVQYRVTIDPNGRMVAMQPVLKASTALTSSIEKALRSWRFNALPSNAPKVNQTGTITFRFRLE